MLLLLCSDSIESCHRRCTTSRQSAGLLFHIDSKMSFASGGTGGLGLLTATWLSQRSVSAIVLGGRSGKISNPADLQVFTSMDCMVTLFAGDSASADATSGLLSSNNSQSLAGIMHAAGIQVKAEASLKGASAKDVQNIINLICKYYRLACPISIVL